MESESYAGMVYEHLLLTRYALQDAAPFGRTAALDRSATVLLARLEAQGPMSVGGLADAFGLDISTVHRQVAAAIKAGLIERIQDHKGGAARQHRPTEEGSRRLEEELLARQGALREATSDWSEQDLQSYVQLTRRLNQGIEQLRERPWPRTSG